jgi:two-component system, chemotaxis family, response regulator Rcp1
MTRQGEPIQILLIEDNPPDIRMISECLREWRIKNHLYVVRDGNQALDFLHSRGNFVGSPRPDLMLLDLNLSKNGGNELLSTINKNPSLSNITIVVVTTFDPMVDLGVWNDLGASLCITKPLDYAEYFQAIKYIEELWITSNQVANL